MAGKAKDAKKKLKQSKWEFIIINAAMILLGVTMLIFTKNIESLLCVAFGIGMCIWGLARIITYFMSRPEDILTSFGMVQGAALIGFGIFFLVSPQLFAGIIRISIAIIIIVSAVVKFQYAFDCMKLKSKFWIIELIAAVLMLTFGILAIMKPGFIADMLMLFMGISLIVGSAWDIIAVLFISSMIKKGSKKEKMIEAKADDKPEAIEE